MPEDQSTQGPEQTPSGAGGCTQLKIRGTQQEVPVVLVGTGLAPSASQVGEPVSGLLSLERTGLSKCRLMTRLAPGLCFMLRFCFPHERPLPFCL